jgi:2-keto-4-pentenoate hydratase/2-oxohepta-3-ene-1,7-dioic acid hydratase in catechol pathway
LGRLIVRYRQAEVVRWGELEGPPPTAADARIQVRPLAVEAHTTAELIATLADRQVGAGPAVEVLAGDLLSPVTADAQLFAQGLNYQSHAAEAQHAKRTSNLIFAKASSSLTGPFSPIVRPPEVQLLDYEVEFGIVLRRDIGAGDAITDATVGDYVAGVVLCNDVSARDTMFGTSFLQWYRGKGYRTFCPTGPVLLLLEPGDVADVLSRLDLKLWVNGDLRQSATSAQLIWKPAETLAYIASTIDMRRGDMVLTGTPGGVTAPASPAMVEILKTHLLADDVRRDALRVEMTKGRPFLKPGDLVTATLAELDGISLGGLANPVIDAA